MNALLEMLCDHYRIAPKYRPDFCTRAVYVTRLPGNYGQSSFYVLTVEGSPPKATIFVYDGWEARGGHFNNATLIDIDGRSRRMGDAQTKIVRTCLKEWLVSQ